MTHILMISGSLRAASHNTALLRAAAELAPPQSTLTLADISEIPLYNGDMDKAGGPPSVRRLKEQIAAADGLLVATPEYNYGIPGVLKNAIDWVSRPAYQSVLARKPVAIIGAAASIVGTARAQAHLKQVLLGTLCEIFPYPEVLVGSAHTRVKNGQLTDEDTRDFLAKMLAAYIDWVASSTQRA